MSDRPGAVGAAAVARALAGRKPLNLSTTGPRAAVALVLRSAGVGGLELLFIRRAEHERDPWSGQVGFPGGRAEPGDAHLEATAVRETYEETGLDLATDAESLGALDQLRARAGGREVDLVIAPFVFRLLRPADGSPSREAVSLHWLALDALLDPDSRSTFEYRRDGQSVTLPCLRGGALVIWGLTFRMFENLASVLAGGPGKRPS